MKWDKNYWVTCAVYRFLKMKKIDKEAAIYLMVKRGKVKENTARACVENWLEWPLNPKRQGFTQ